jgi:hypothetical protein
MSSYRLWRGCCNCCLQLRLAGNMLAMGGDFDDAIQKYKQVRQAAAAAAALH